MYGGFGGNERSRFHESCRLPSFSVAFDAAGSLLEGQGGADEGREKLNNKMKLPKKKGKKKEKEKVRSCLEGEGGAKVRVACD